MNIVTGQKTAGLVAGHAELELSFLCSRCLAVGLPLPVLYDEASQRADNLKTQYITTLMRKRLHSKAFVY